MQVDNPQETVEAIKHGDIDESLYSRQLLVLNWKLHHSPRDNTDNLLLGMCLVMKL